MGKKRFIKKDDIMHRYRVIARSQQDPLIADEKAPKSVLVNTDEKEEYGIYFDDQYNYLQHLKGVKDTVEWQDCEAGEVYTIRAKDLPKDDQAQGLNLPSSAFESYVQEPIGLLHKAAPLTGPQPGLDPEIVAQLDEGELVNETEDWEFDTMMTKLNKDACDEDNEPLSDVAEDGDSVDNFSVSGMSEKGSYRFDDDKNSTDKQSSSGFTRYSLSSVSLPRTEQEEFFCKRWEAFHLKHYGPDSYQPDNPELGRMGQIKASDAFANMPIPKVRKGFAEDFPEEKEFNKSYILATEEQRNQTEKAAKRPVKKARLTKKSLAQHDAAVAKEEEPPKQYMPVIPEDPHCDSGSGESDKEDSEEGATERSFAETFKTAWTLASTRSKFETPEERRQRKKDIKELRKIRRQSKKATKLAYKETRKAQCKNFTSVRYKAL